VDKGITRKLEDMKKTIDEQYELAVLKLGMNGHLISWSKSGYRDSHPDNIVIFNANICTKSGKIWYGDIDVTKSKQTLQELASELDQDVFILYEMDGRFDNEERPRLENYVVKFTPEDMMLKNKMWT